MHAPQSLVGRYDGLMKLAVGGIIKNAVGGGTPYSG